MVRPREPWQFVLVAVFALSAAADLSIVVNWIGGDNEPPAIVLWHGVTFVAALVCLVSIWGRQSWAPYAVAAWGIASATLVLSLPLLLPDLPSKAVPGIWAGGGIVGVLAAICVWVIWRKTRS